VRAISAEGSVFARLAIPSSSSPSVKRLWVAPTFAARAWRATDGRGRAARSGHGTRSCTSRPDRPNRSHRFYPKHDWIRVELFPEGPTPTRRRTLHQDSLGRTARRATRGNSSRELSTRSGGRTPQAAIMVRRHRDHLHSGRLRGEHAAAESSKTRQSLGSTCKEPAALKNTPGWVCEGLDSADWMTSKRPRSSKWSRHRSISLSGVELASPSGRDHW